VVSVADMQTLPPTQMLSEPDLDPPGSGGGSRQTPARSAGGSGGNRVTPPRPPEGVELYDFLAPAQSPGELGRLGGYRILKVIGAGGMGVVFQAEDVQLKRPVALKAMLPVMAASPSNRQRFMLEAQAAAALEHDHIITIYQVGEDRSIPFIAMQLLKGESLEDRLQRVGLIGLAEGLLIARQVALGLTVAHEQGLIHRDIKPSNLFLVKDGGAGGAKPNGAHPGGVSPSPTHHLPLPTHQTRVKILDFGLARSVTGDSQLTRNGAIIGTPAYMAPEQSRGQKVDGRSDLFSLGCVLYRMYTGRLPFPGADTITVLLALASENPRPPHQVNAQVPPQLSRLIMDLLAKDPKSRPQSARDVVHRIQQLERELSLESAESGSSAVGQGTSPPRTPTLVEQQGGTGPHTDFLEPGLDFLEQGQGGRKKRLWLWVACLGGGGLALLAACLVVLILVLGGSGSSDGERTGDAEEKDGKKKENEPPRPAALDPETVALLRNSLLNGSYVQTEVVGFPHAQDFLELAPGGGLLIGFEFGLGNVWGPSHINSIRPIFLTAKGEVLGEVRGTPTKKMVTVKAKKGYAVAAVEIKAGLQLDSMRITFMRIDKKFLDVDQSYQSEVIGPPAAGKRIGSTGALVIGICGKSNGQACQALGLVLRGKVK
jgi:serine/threonine protein kinase